MSYTAEQLLSLATHFETLAKTAKEKLDSKAKVRNRGTVCVPAESAKDKKDHFPINNEAQARNALARVNQFSKVPDWYNGSLQGLVNLVARKVKSKYPSIEVSKDAKKPGKKTSSHFDTILKKISQRISPGARVKVELENLRRKVNTREDGLNASDILQKWPGELRNFNEKINQAIQYADNAPLFMTRSTVKDALSALNGFNTEMAKGNFDNVYQRMGGQIFQLIDSLMKLQSETPETNVSPNPDINKERANYWGYPNKDETVNLFQHLKLDPFKTITDLKNAPPTKPAESAYAVLESVRDYQNWLKSQGREREIAPYGADGKFGPLTQKAILKDFPNDREDPWVALQAWQNKEQPGSGGSRTNNIVREPPF